MVRRMNGRLTSSLFASLLVFFQLLVSPLAHAMPTANDDCGSMDQTMHMAGDDHHCGTDAACSCPCAHTPALNSFRLLFAGPMPPEAVVSALAAPTFDSPLFDLLRPPN